MHSARHISRRQLLRLAGATAAAGASGGGLADLVAQNDGRFSIGACDWSIGMRGRVGALDLARQFGIHGAQVSMGNVENDLHLRTAEVQRAYREAAAAHGVRIAGVGLDIMNEVPYKSDPRTIKWVADSIDVARALDVRVVLLAFFMKGDLKNDPEGQAEVVRRLKGVAPKAERAGVVLGIESWLSAPEHLRIIEAVGSPAVKVYYDVANSHHMGYDIYQEIRQLGSRYICEFHAKENGFLLGQGRIDFAAVRKAMDDIGYTGWIQIEGAIPEGKPMFESYVANAEFMRTKFE